MRYLNGDALDQMFAQIGTGGAVAWYLTDRLGSTRALVSNNGNVLDTITYDAWGKIASQMNPSAQPLFLFTGIAYDAPLGLYFNGNGRREYDPETGRFIEQDPMQFHAGDSNLYRYVRNDPTNAVDLSRLANIKEVEKQFMQWYEQEKQDIEWLKGLPPPPSQIEIKRYIIGYRIGYQLANEWKIPIYKEVLVVPEGWVQDNPISMKKYHPNAAYELRSAKASKGGSGQQAMYDRQGRLITGGLSADTPDRVGPAGWKPFTWYAHKRVDVAPFDWVAELDSYYGGNKFRKKYLEVRPPHPGKNALRNIVN